MFAGAALNYTPDQLQKAFGPGGLTFDTTDRFGINSSEVPSTKSTLLRDTLSQFKNAGLDLNSLGGVFALQNIFTQNPKEQLDAYMPFMMKMREFDANLADNQYPDQLLWVLRQQNLHANLKPHCGVNRPNILVSAPTHTIRI